MAFDAFLKIDGIPGESSDDKHKEWIEVLSYSHGVSQASSGSASTGGGRSAERCNHSDFSIVKALDKASPKLALACCNGTHIKEVKLELCRAAGDKTKYMEYKLTNAIITSVTPRRCSPGRRDPAPGRGGFQLRQDRVDLYGNRPQDRQGLGRRKGQLGPHREQGGLRRIENKEAVERMNH